MLGCLADAVEMGLWLCIFPCRNWCKGSYKLVRILILVIQLRNHEASDWQHCDLSVEELITVVHVHRLNVCIRNLALIFIFHIVTELQPLFKHWMIKVYSRHISIEHWVVRIVGPHSHVVIMIPGMEIGTIALTCAFTLCHLVGIVTIICPCPVKLRNRKTSLIQIVLINQYKP